MGTIVLWAAGAIVGHWIVCCALWSRATSLNVPGRVVRWIERTAVLALVAYPPVLLICLLLGIADSEQQTRSVASGLHRQLSALLPPAMVYYGHACAALVGLSFPGWLMRRIREARQPMPRVLKLVDVAQKLGRAPVGSRRARLAVKIPGNQVLQLEVNEKTLTLPRLGPALDGLTIAHLADLHFTGKITREFFDVVVEETNALGAELICVTGDVLDDERCCDWFYPVLGALRAPLGVFGILGNHDQRTGNIEILRKHMVDCGVVNLGGRWCEVPIRGERVLLAGNEAPWMPAADVQSAPTASAHALRLLLTHSPDQFDWARRWQFDLALAGHTHGGQVRIPGFGPLISPSRYGTRYASGIFCQAPTLLHVTRGISAVHPLRWNCRPELTRLVLRRA